MASHISHFAKPSSPLALHTRCYAVDTWQGDEQAGFYGEEVFEQVRRHNDQAYGDFSQLLRMTFDEALERISQTARSICCTLTAATPTKQ
jgi:hypothetical protein